jgi:hypothetical protein
LTSIEGFHPQTLRLLERGVVGADRDDGTCRRRHLVGADADILGDCDGLTFVEHSEPVALFDRKVLDRELRIVPAAHRRTLVHDEGAEVPRVEHDEVGRLAARIEPHERADQDAEAAEVGVAGDILAGRWGRVGYIYIVDISKV